MFKGRCPNETFDLYAGEVYIQHNPHVGGGKEAFAAYFERMEREYPGKRVHFKRVTAGVDFVVLHGFEEWPGDEDDTGIDIFRFDSNGKIVEHLDVLQAIPTSTANEDAMC